MGRRRAANEDHSDDDGIAAACLPGPGAGGLSSQLGSAGGKGGKKYVPGMGGKDKKARAKEQRLEPERRKADRDKRNDNKRQQAEEDGVAEAVDTPGVRRQGQQRGGARHNTDSPVGVTSAGAGAGINHDGAQIRRELRRLFGRVKHGGGVSPITGRHVAVDDVVVLLLDAAAGDRRKSGAGAWSQRMNKKGEREVTMAAFIAPSGGGGGGGGSSSVGGILLDGSCQISTTQRISGRGDGGTCTSEGTPPAAGPYYSSSPAVMGDAASEPAYHLVRRVVARWTDGGGGEETLWTNHHADINTEDAAAVQVSGLRISGSAEVSGSYGGGHGSFGSYGGGGSAGGLLHRFEAPSTFKTLNFTP